MAPGALESLGTAYTGFLMNVGGLIFLCVIAWQALKVVLAGGSERAVQHALIRIFFTGAALAALLNIGAVGEVAKALGTVVVQAVIQGVQGALPAA